LEVVLYPHPTLRYHSKVIQRVDAELVRAVHEMFELMYATKGIGLAANQVDMPLRLFIANPAGEKGDGEELVFLNPVLSSPKGSEEAEEGCLSFPEMYGQVKRPKQITVNAYNLKGEEIEARVDGMLARVVQHETDHLDGVLFTDRMSATAKAQVLPVLEEFELAFQSRRRLGEIPDDQTLLARLKQWEQKYG
jgi:peptide deformylase